MFITDFPVESWAEESLSCSDKIISIAYRKAFASFPKLPRNLSLEVSYILAIGISSYPIFVKKILWTYIALDCSSSSFEEFCDLHTSDELDDIMPIC